MNWKRVAAARAAAQTMLLFAGLLMYFALSGFIAAPAFTGPDHVPSIAGIPITLLGVGGMLVGLGWMWRIYRAPTRFEGAHWRFRDH